MNWQNYDLTLEGGKKMKIAWRVEHGAWSLAQRASCKAVGVWSRLYLVRFIFAGFACFSLHIDFRLPTEDCRLKTDYLLTIACFFLTSHRSPLFFCLNHFEIPMFNTLSYTCCLVVANMRINSQNCSIANYYNPAK